MTRNPHELPPNLPVPVDDGAADHLTGMALPDVTLESTSGAFVRLADLQGPVVLFFYPRTGIPGQLMGPGFQGESWDEIAGARGCTPQNCAFRDAYGEFRELGVQVYGVSTQTYAYQWALKEREHIPFEYLSDQDLALVKAMRLPTFEFPVAGGGPDTLIRRMSWFVEGGRIRKVWYPVFPPNENAERVLVWLRERKGGWDRG